MGEVPRRRGLLWKMEQALRPFLPIVSLLATAGLEMKNKIFINKKKRNNYHLWEQLSFLPSQGAIGTRSYSSRCFQQNHRWDPGWACRQEKFFLLKPFHSCRRGSGHQGWGAPGHQAEGGHPSPVLPGSEVQKFNVDDQPLYLPLVKQIVYCHMEWSTRWPTFVSSNQITKNIVYCHREWSTRCGWTSSVKFRRPLNSK